MELYDLRDDPKEWNNRANNAAYAPVAKQFEALVPQHFAEETTGPLMTKVRRRWDSYTDWLDTALSFSDPCDP